MMLLAAFPFSSMLAFGLLRRPVNYGRSVACGKN